MDTFVAPDDGARVGARGWHLGNVTFGPSGPAFSVLAGVHVIEKSLLNHRKVTKIGRAHV